MNKEELVFSVELNEQALRELLEKISDHIKDHLHEDWLFRLASSKNTLEWLTGSLHFGDKGPYLIIGTSGLARLSMILNDGPNRSL